MSQAGVVMKIASECYLEEIQKTMSYYETRIGKGDGNRTLMINMIFFFPLQGLENVLEM